MSDNEKSEAEDIEEVVEEDQASEGEDEDDDGAAESSAEEEEEKEAPAAKKSKKPVSEEKKKTKDEDAPKKKKTSKSASPRKFENYFCQEARAIAAELKQGKPEVRDKSGKVISPAVPPMPGIPDNDKLEEYKHIYDERGIFSGEELQDTSKFIILHKERAAAYEPLIEKTKDKGEDNKYPDLAVTFTNTDDFASWRDDLKAEGLLVTAEHHRIVLEKKTGAVYWLLDATRLEAAGRHFVQQLRGKQDRKVQCQSQINASQAEYKERNHSLEEQDAPDYDPDNIKTHVFVQLCDIQKRTIYPESRAFLHGLSDAKNKLRMYDDVTCHIPSHILVPHLHGLMKNAERRKGGTGSAASKDSGKAKEGGNQKGSKDNKDSKDSSKSKRPPRPKMSTHAVQAPIIRPSGGEEEPTAPANKLLALAGSGAVDLNKLDDIKGEYMRKEAEAAARLSAYRNGMREALSMFGGRVVQGDQAVDERVKYMEELGSKGAPGRYLERIFMHPSAEERKKRVNTALIGASGCIKEDLKFLAGDPEGDDSAVKALVEQGESLNEQVEELNHVYSLADDAPWRELLKEADGREGPVGEFLKWLVPKGQRALARKFFMPALLIGADTIDRAMTKHVDKLASEIAKILSAYEAEAKNYQSTIQSFAEACANTAHHIQNSHRADKEAREKEIKALSQKLEELNKDLESRTSEAADLKKKLAARDKEIEALKAKPAPAAASKPKAIPPDPKPGDKRKEANGGETTEKQEEKKSKKEEKKNKDEAEKKGEKRKEAPKPAITASSNKAASKDEASKPTAAKKAAPQPVEDVGAF